MSLKSFHIFFIVVSTITTLGFGIWSLAQYMDGAEMGDLLWGIVSLAACGALIWYSVTFFKKLKKLGPTPRE